MSLTKLLKPLKDKTIEIEITKGLISLIPCIIELYGIKIKLKKNNYI
jgi:hypothetical protein